MTKKVPIITIPACNPPGIFYGFIGKSLVGSSFYYTLNHKQDPNVLNNRKLVLSSLNKNDHVLYFLHQVHSDDCVVAEDILPLGQEIKADGSVTVNRNIILAIITADCVPVLFYDVENQIIGACHAGWKGAIGGIVESTIDKMLKQGARISSITAIIGPCIQQGSYEVNKDFYQQFLMESIENKQFFIDSVNLEHYMFDLPGYVMLKLGSKNIDKIFNSKLDTLTNEEEFFSYRRNSLKKQELDGNILSVIGFK